MEHVSICLTALGLYSKGEHLLLIRVRQNVKVILFSFSQNNGVKEAVWYNIIWLVWIHVEEKKKILLQECTCLQPNL